MARSGSDCSADLVVSMPGRVEEPEPEPEPESESEPELSLAPLGADVDEPIPEDDDSALVLRPDSFVQGRRVERLAAATAARRELPDAAREWSVADVRSYFSGLGLAAAGEQLAAEDVHGECLLALGRDDELLGALGDVQLSIGKQFAVRSAVAGLGGRPAMQKHGFASEDSGDDDPTSPPAVQKALGRWMAKSLKVVDTPKPAGSSGGNYAPSAAPADAPRRRRPKTKKGNLSKAQVKHRTKVAEGYGVAFIAIEIIIVMTGSGSAWIHLVSMLPGMMMMVAGVTASFST